MSESDVGVESESGVDAELPTLGAYLETLSSEELEMFHQAQQVWPPIDAVAHTSFDGENSLGSVWIGPHLAARPHALERRRITHVLCLTAEAPPPTTVAHAHVRHLPLDDDPHEDLLGHLEDSISWISQAVAQGGRVLCHCRAGRSRSAAVVAAYLVGAHGCTTEAAIDSVRSARPFININFGFLQQLKAFSAQMTQSCESCELCRLERVTPWFEEHEAYTVLICDQCDNPMVVSKRHTQVLSHSEREAMRQALTRHADRELGHGNWYMDCRQRTIKDHVHWHARPHTSVTRLLASRRAARL